MYEDIYEHNKGLLFAIARRYERICALDRAVSIEDLTQEGFIALVRAADTFDESAGKTWAGWATWHIRREYERALGLRERRFRRAHTGAVSLDQPINGGEADGTTVGDTLADTSLPDADEDLLLNELRQDVREALLRLEDGRQRRALQLCQLEGRSVHEAARAMGTTSRQVQRLCERADANLARDRKLRAWVGLDERTRFHAHKGVRAFNIDWTSVTEGAAMWRIEEQKRMEAGKRG